MARAGCRTIAAMSSYAFRVQVRPRYLPDQSAPAQGRFVFAYTITVTNVGLVAAQLIARHWVIHDDAGHVEQVRGLGVVGRQPLLAPGEAFEYTSGCELRTPGGSMQGSYFCVAEDGTRFDVPIAAFSLDAAPAAPGSVRVLH